MPYGRARFTSKLSTRSNTNKNDRNTNDCVSTVGRPVMLSRGAQRCCCAAKKKK